MLLLILAFSIILIFFAIIWILVALQLVNLALVVFVVFAIVIFLFFLVVVKEAVDIIYKKQAPYIRSSQNLIDRILNEVDFKKDAQVYELGCGDARFLRSLVKKYPVKAIGYEYAWPPFLIGKIINAIEGLNVRILRQDLFQADLSQADYVFCYLLPIEMSRLQKKFEQELKSGAVVIANSFQIENWQPVKKFVINPKKRAGLSNRIYVYKMV